ncbi:MAG TPA: hypothetical protein VFH95_05145 [Candidatus Kapabacteria bacterium]|nr:hypothetical protein [Candidatus Kapabacteria bacterium]
MTKRQFVVLAFRLFALYLVFNVITNLGYFLSMLQFEHDFAGAALTAAFGIAILLFALSLLWRKSEWLMEKVFAIPALSNDPEPESEDTGSVHDSTNSGAKSLMDRAEVDYYETPLSAESLQTVAFSLTGLWAIFNNLPHLVRELDVTFGGAIPPASNWYAMSLWLPDTIVVALGLWLFLRPWQFQGWIEKFKPKAASTGEIAN